MIWVALFLALWCKLGWRPGNEAIIFSSSFCSQNGVYINAQGWIGIPKHQNVNNAGCGFWCPDWLAIFWRAYIHFSLVRTADLNSVLRANFARTKPETSCILLQY